MRTDDADGDERQNNYMENKMLHQRRSREGFFFLLFLFNAVEWRLL